MAAALIGMSLVVLQHACDRKVACIFFSHQPFDVRREFLQCIEHVLEEDDRYVVQTGLDFWFTPPTSKPPVPWKQFLLTLSAFFR